MNVVFRVDSSTAIGSGHLMRCLALAESLDKNGVEITFICRDLGGNLTDEIKHRQMKVITLPCPEFAIKAEADIYSNSLGVRQLVDAHETAVSIGNEIKPDWLIVDHYSIGEEWENYISNYCSKIMVIDDLANRKHYCHLLLDQNYSSENNDRYKVLTPSFCRFLLGPQYSLLRSEFGALRRSDVSFKSAIKRLLIFFTAGDDQGETLKAMNGVKIFSKNKRIDVDVVVGSANLYQQPIEEMCSVHNWGYHCQVNYMPALIAGADIVIGSGGSSNWERCALGVPGLVVILAENQAAIARDLDSAGVVINLGWNTRLESIDYASALAAIGPEKLNFMSLAAYQMVDGAGASRVSDSLKLYF